MAQVLRATTETERPGKILVRAKAAPGRENDAKPVAGFFVRRRYAGDEFRINDWNEFSPRWMEFVDEPPKDWLKKIGLREEDREQFMAKAMEENKLTPQELMQRQVFSMAQAAQPKLVELDYANGGTKSKDH